MKIILPKFLLLSFVLVIFSFFSVQKAAAATPDGYFDGVDNTSGLMWGWAYDPDSPATSINVHIYADGPAGSGKFVGETTANLYRKDLNKNYGFNYYLPAWLKDGKSHLIYVHGIDTSRDGTQNLLLKTTPKTFLGTLVKVEGRVVTDGTSNDIWQNSKDKCGNFKWFPNLRVNGSYNLDNCGPDVKAQGPYYVIDKVPTGMHMYTLTGLPAGYTCGAWAVGLAIKDKPNEGKPIGSGRFPAGQMTTCSTPQLDLQPTAAEYGQTYHVWFSIVPPPPTGVPTKIPTTVPTGARVTYTPAPTVKASPVPTGARVTHTPAPTVKTSPSPIVLSPVACEAKTLDLVIVLDKSSSVDTDIEKEKFAAKKLIGGLSGSGGGAGGQIRIGIVTYYKQAVKVTQSLLKIVPGSSDLAKLNVAIDNVKYVSGENGSCIKCAETAANELLSSSKATTKAVVMMTDGRANASGISENPYPAVNAPMREAVAIAQDARAKGIIYYAVGYGSTSRTRGDVISAITGDSLKFTETDVANESYINPTCSYPPTKFSNSSCQRYIYQKDASQWVNAFAKLAGKICPTFESRILNYK